MTEQRRRRLNPWGERPRPGRWPTLRLGVRLVLIAALACVGAHSPSRVSADNEARTPAETFERKGRIADCLVYVARDLKARSANTKGEDPAVLQIVLDATPTLKDEITAIERGLAAAWAEGPEGMQIGVVGLGADTSIPPTRIPGRVVSGLQRVAFLAGRGAPDVMAGIVAGCDVCQWMGDGPRAMLLVSQDHAEMEGDVEAAREALFDAGAAFYCVAGEAAFEQPWVQEFTARDDAANNVTERFHPSPRKLAAGALFWGSEVALGLVPSRWELDFAQTRYYWGRPPVYPVPSGFGYWSLATLCHVTSGRYFIYDYGASALAPTRKGAKQATLYDFSRLALLAPDLRPRSKVLKAMNRMSRAKVIVRIWQRLADEAAPVIQDTGVLERRGSSVVPRPARFFPPGLRSYTWFTDLDEIARAKEQVKTRVRALDESLRWWGSANAKALTGEPSGDSLRERVEANFQLLGAQLRKARFHWGEGLAALESIKPLDVTYRRVRLQVVPLVAGTKTPPTGIALGNDDREARLAELLLTMQRVAERYTQTPWAMVLEKGRVFTFRKHVQVLQQEPRRPKPKPPKPKKGDKPEPTPPPAPPKKPPAGPRPGSGTGGPTTGG